MEKCVLLIEQQCFLTFIYNSVSFIFLTYDTWFRHLSNDKNRHSKLFKKINSKNKTKQKKKETHTPKQTVIFGILERFSVGSSLSGRGGAKSFKAKSFTLKQILWNNLKVKELSTLRAYWREVGTEALNKCWGLLWDQYGSCPPRVGSSLFGVDAFYLGEPLLPAKFYPEAIFT